MPTIVVVTKANEIRQMDTAQMTWPELFEHINNQDVHISAVGTEDGVIPLKCIVCKTAPICSLLGVIDNWPDINAFLKDPANHPANLN